MNVAEKQLTRPEKVARLRRYHEPLFKALGIPNAYFDSKAKNKRAPGIIGAIGFFESQLKSGDDIYFEINDFSQEIIDPKRTLYKLKANPHFTSEPDVYQYVTNTPVGAQYYVTMDHFDIMEFPKKDPVAEAMEVTEKEDVNLDKLTARDWACIHLRVPQSNYEWLDNLIRQSNNQ